jgi:hypothetical protein
VPTPALNNVFSHLQNAVTASTTAFDLLDASAFPQAGWGVIGKGSVDFVNEVFRWTSKTGNTLQGITRGLDGTTAEAHVADAPVGISIIARHITELQVTHGTSAERDTLGLIFGTDEIGHRFWDVTVAELFVWTGTDWAIPTISLGAERGVVDYVLETQAEWDVLKATGSYRKGDRATLLFSNVCTLKICMANLITNTEDDWVSVGRQS